MASILRSTLVNLGVLEGVRPGQPRKYFGEEGQEQKRAKTKETVRIYRAKLKAAAERGEPRPKLKPGRPRIYASAEEAKLAVNDQNRICRERQQQRLLEGVERLSQLVADAKLRSSDE